ncbi:Putative_papain-like cysteine peptidase (DUF1796) [Hexamita inflata]|uniref:Papain-like cysteine peptidase (DUF1796) n=1 Tax=Hexamita inflata TaxID=28002 RepID=A0AA86U0J2_9EUKA|nr:Putative papain-like cysteine peptidase (DUF1796) [Hexamita inflata]
MMCFQIVSLGLTQIILNSSEITKFGLNYNINSDYNTGQQQIAVFSIMTNIAYIDQQIKSFLAQPHSNTQLFVLHTNASKTMSYINHKFKQEVHYNESKLNDFDVVTVGNIFFVKIDNTSFTNIADILLRFSNASIFCNWSPLSFSSSDRIATQFSHMTEDGYNVSVLNNTSVYNYRDQRVNIKEGLDLETVMFKREYLENLNPNQDSFEDFAAGLIDQGISVVEANFLYLDLSGKYEDVNYKFDQSRTDHYLQLISPKLLFDAVLSLGAWCQVGSTQFERGLSVVHSPFYGFGYKLWESVILAIEQDFRDYWSLEKTSVGRTEVHQSYKYKENRRMLQVYDNTYDIFSCHHFEADDCRDGIRSEFGAFKDRMNEKIRVFKQQAQQYERVLFCMKVMNSKLETTQIKYKQILRLINALSSLRNGKPFTLRLLVPAWFEQSVQDILGDLKAFVQVKGWTEQWNDDYYEADWNWMFGDVVVADQSFERNLEIVGSRDGLSREEYLEYINS